MSTQHTPGPWFTDDKDKSDSRRYVLSNDSIICAIRLDERAEADARLIAAAPELLEALQTCERWFTKHCPTSPLINNLGHAEHPMLTCIRAAIANATGDQL